jgi:hypothetical protein
MHGYVVLAHLPHHCSPTCLIIYNKMATAPPSTANAGAIFFIAAAPWLPTLLVPLLGLPPVPTAWATWTPYWVAVVSTPLTVVVTALVAVVLAVQPSQLIHGASVLQEPCVQPGQSLSGQALPPHHWVHGPLRQALLDCHAEGPQLFDPQGPQPLGPPQ